MVIRITLRQEDSSTIASVAGRLDEEHLAELQKQCSGGPMKWVFDLSELKSADKAAIRWLAKRLARGDEILGPSPYIKLLLELEQRRSDSLTTAGSRNSGEEDE